MPTRRPRPQLVFLGTGAAGGTPGSGRSRRRESSAYLRVGGRRLLIDVTRDAAEQLAGLPLPDGVLLTHAHRDASGGIPVLDRMAAAAGRRIRVLCAPATAHAVRHRRGVGRLENLVLDETAAGQRRRLGGLGVVAAEVPHSHDPRFPTYAWRVTAHRRRLVYASDVAALTDALRDLSSGADVLVLDGAMYGRSIFTHLRIDQALPRVCGWDVDRILLTQLGRTVPPHEEARRLVADLCARATVAHDGMTVTI